MTAGEGVRRRGKRPSEKRQRTSVVQKPFAVFISLKPCFQTAGYVGYSVALEFFRQVDPGGFVFLFQPVGRGNIL
ncbi:hypothetical protein HMPREF9120_00967 [Neisseria sp. oral taxon 020 str. F0370]|nr:hypothetical protein HMPREF9120_00967 [Neisseria sp. oral taxon 020 str. F0370]